MLNATLDGPPTVLWQTYQTDEMPSVVRRVRDDWVSENPGLDARYMSDRECEAFIAERFEPRVLRAFQALPLGVMKADFWRLAVVYEHGGLYADVDVVPRKPMREWLDWNDSKCSLLLGLENSINFSNWAFAATPRHPALLQVILLVVERLERGVNISDENFVHFHTGPGVLTAGIRAYAGRTGTRCSRLRGEHGLVKTSGTNICFMTQRCWQGACIENMYASQFGYRFGLRSWTDERDELRRRQGPQRRLGNEQLPPNIPCGCFSE